MRDRLGTMAVTGAAGSGERSRLRSLVVRPGGHSAARRRDARAVREHPSVAAQPPRQPASGAVQAPAPNLRRVRTRARVRAVVTDVALVALAALLLGAGPLGTGIAVALYVAVIAARDGYGHACLDGVVARSAVFSGIVALLLLALTAGYLGALRVAPVGLAVATLAIAAGSLVYRALCRRLSPRYRTLLVGDGARLSRDLRLDSTRAHRLELVGTVEPRGAASAAAAAAEARRTGAEYVLVQEGALSAAEVRELTWGATGATVLVAPPLSDVALGRLELGRIGSGPVLAVRTAPLLRHRVGKAVMDRVLGALLVLAALPVLAVCALAVRRDSPGPVLFRQRRVGLDGVPFTMLKFRTMVLDAEARKAELAALSDGNGTLFKMREDPRVTPVGRVLRRFSLDELPQLWNVVRGDMSLVGPRPPLPEEVAAYDERTYHRMLVRPGLTGLWQVSGRSDLSWEESVRLDLDYTDNWSPALDLRIIGRTARAVLGAHGAY